jgi:hypothetical protein
VTPLGWVLMAILAAGAIVAAVGPTSTQPVGLIAVAAVGVVLFGGGLSGRGHRRTGKTLAQRRAEFGPRARRSPDDRASAGPDEVWQRERERRREQDGGVAATDVVAASAPEPDMPDIGL